MDADAIRTGQLVGILGQKFFCWSELISASVWGSQPLTGWTLGFLPFSLVTEKIMAKTSVEHLYSSLAVRALPQSS